MLNTQSNNSIQNKDRIWHATSGNNKLSSSFHNKVVLDFLEILENHEQLCYKTSQANYKVNQVKYHKEDISIQIRTESVTPLHKLITGDLDHQKVWSLTI